MNLQELIAAVEKAAAKAGAAADERLFAMGLCSPDGRWLVRTSSFPRELSCQQAETVAARLRKIGYKGAGLSRMLQDSGLRPL